VELTTVLAGWSGRDTATINATYRTDDYASLKAVPQSDSRGTHKLVTLVFHSGLRVVPI